MGEGGGGRPTVERRGRHVGRRGAVGKETTAKQTPEARGKPTCKYHAHSRRDTVPQVWGSVQMGGGGRLSCLGTSRCPPERAGQEAGEKRSLSRVPKRTPGTAPDRDKSGKIRPRAMESPLMQVPLWGLLPGLPFV